jgi:ribosomal protein L16/L10AE
MSSFISKRPRNFLYNFGIYNKNGYLFFDRSILIRSTNCGILFSSQIETMRRILSRQIKGKRGKVYIRVRVSLPLTQKSKQSRMGKGKGKVKLLFCRVKAYSPLYELIGKKVEPILIRALCRKLHYKAPFLEARVDNRIDGICRNKVIRKRQFRGTRS